MNRVNSHSGSALLRGQHRERCIGHYYYYSYYSISSIVYGDVCNCSWMIGRCWKVSSEYTEAWVRETIFSNDLDASHCLYIIQRVVLSMLLSVIAVGWSASVGRSAQSLLGHSDSNLLQAEGRVTVAVVEIQAQLCSSRQRYVRRTESMWYLTYP